MPMSMPRRFVDTSLRRLALGAKEVGFNHFALSFGHVHQPADAWIMPRRVCLDGRERGGIGQRCLTRHNEPKGYDR